MQRAEAAARPHGVGIAFESILDPESLTLTSEIIGRGATGIVYRGTLAQAAGDESVAVKMLAPGATPAEHAGFVREFNTHQHAASKCRGVAQVFGCVKRGDALALVMKLYQRSLKDYLSVPLDAPPDAVRQPLPLPEAMAMLVQIATNLAEVHAANVRVQDLKPGNILMDENGKLFLADFGLASLIVKTIQTIASSPGGTPNYSPPEQLDSDLGPLTEKIDIWAFACVAYELLTGELPWKGKTHMQLMTAVLMHKQTPALPAGCLVPDGMAEVLAKCWSYDPAGRPSADQLAVRMREMAAPYLAASGAQAASGDAAAVDIQTLRAELEARLAQAEAEAEKLQQQMQQMQAQFDQKLEQQAQQLQAQHQLQIQQVVAASDQKLANLSVQLQEEITRKIQAHSATAMSPAVTGWLDQLEQELAKQQQPQPEPAPAYTDPAVAARSAATAAGTDELTAAMEAEGLTASDQAVLIEGGVDCVQTFGLLQDEDFTTYSIDIAARRRAKAAADKAYADAQTLRELLQREGREISAAGQELIAAGAKNMTQLCSLDLAGMKALGLGIVDARLLANLMGASPTVARFRVRAQEPKLAAVSDAGWEALGRAGATSVAALLTLGQDETRKAQLLKALSRADQALVAPLLAEPLKHDVFVKAHEDLRIGDGGSTLTVVSGASGRLYISAFGEAMHSGRHYTEWTVVKATGTTDHVIGVAPPGTMERMMKGYVFHEPAVAFIAAWTSRKGFGALKQTYDKTCTVDSDPTTKQGDTFGLLLDCAAGTLTVTHNGNYLGTFSGLKAPLCWAASMFFKGSVLRVKRLPAPK